MIDFHPHTEPCYMCRATAWEWTGEFVPAKGKPEDVVACAFCGARARVPAQPRPVAPPKDADEFRFQFGRFKGMTFAEADAEPNGRRYLEVLRDTNAKLRERIEGYLNATALDSGGDTGQIVCLSEQTEAKECHAKPPSSPQLFG
jgi:hypothetical protein